MEYQSERSTRVAELRARKNGIFQAEWVLSDTSLVDAVRLTMPPGRALPIVFVPGIMGTNLADQHGKPVWLLNTVKGVPTHLVKTWASKTAGERQSILHPKRTSVFPGGNVPDEPGALGYKKQDYIDHGWGEVAESSYQSFLMWLEKKMNLERNPANWEDFVHESINNNATYGEKLGRRLPPGLLMKMAGLPEHAEPGFLTEPVNSDELLSRASFSFPIYAFGYNWLASNMDAAQLLKIRIEKIIQENNRAGVKCTQVLVVTHSMGGLVARACSQMPGMANKIVGIVHGVMPATGASVAYRRCKVGMKDEDAIAGMIIGSSGKEIAAVFAQAPGALQLLPSEDYGQKWMEIRESKGREMLALPISDPYEEIYLQRDKWWGLIQEAWLSPDDGNPVDWEKFEKNIMIAKDFHRFISKKYHRNTYVFYGGGEKKGSFGKICWKVSKGESPASKDKAPPIHDVTNIKYKNIRATGFNDFYVGGESTVRKIMHGEMEMPVLAETSHWEIHSANKDSAGDGTVPICSGRSPRNYGGMSIRQQFEIPEIEHEPAYKNTMARQVTYYALTKLAALAEKS